MDLIDEFGAISAALQHATELNHMLVEPHLPEVFRALWSRCSSHAALYELL